LKRKFRKSVADRENIDENLIRMNLNWIQRKITIVSVYASSEDEELITVDQFFTKLNRLISEIEEICFHKVILTIQQKER